MRSKREKLPNQIDLRPAAKRQVKYAASLGIILPEEATVSDASALINRELDDDRQGSKELLEYAAANDIVCSDYAGNKFLHNLLFDHLEGEKKAAFFCFCVYKFYLKTQGHSMNTSETLNREANWHPNHGLCENMYKHKDSQIFETFGKTYGQDFYFTVSMEDYHGEELICFGKSIEVSEDGRKRTVYGGSVHTTAFKKAYEYLQDWGMLSK